MTKTQSSINVSQGKTNEATGVSLKEFFERVVRLETKFDEALVKSTKSTRYFKTAMYVLVFIELINFVLNLFILHWHTVASLLGGTNG